MNRPHELSLIPSTALQINGRPVHVSGSGARRLADVLRDDLGLCLLYTSDAADE